MRADSARSAAGGVPRRRPCLRGAGTGSHSARRADDDPERLAAIGASARGFLYTVSVVGTTGERSALGGQVAGVVARAKASTSVPVAIGFGIATAEQAREAAEAGADGVIVGTRLVRAAYESAGDPAAAVGAVVEELAAGLR